MKECITKFLEFKGKTLLFLVKNGTYYIAIRPVCEAINVSFVKQRERIIRDPILGPAYTNWGMQVPGDQFRKMACLPEEYIYGWIFSIQSDTPELIKYKQECYHILFDFFHGTITSRRDLFREKVKIRAERQKLEERLREAELFKQWESLRAREARLGILFKQIDENDLREAIDLFSSSGITIDN